MLLSFAGGKVHNAKAVQVLQIHGFRLNVTFAFLGICWRRSIEPNSKVIRPDGY